MNLKKKIIFLVFIISFFSIGNLAYAKENDYTNLPTKYINGKEVIYGIDGKQNTVGEVINSNNFNSKYTVKAFKNNIELTSSQRLGTNTILRIYDKNNIVKEYNVLLYGDVIGDGNISSIDSLAIVKNKLQKIKITDEINLEAGRIMVDERESKKIPDSIDALAIVKYKLGKYEIEQGKKIDNKDDDKNDNKDDNKNENEDITIDTNTPVGKHGKLSVVGKNLVDKNLNNYQLKGVSTHGIAWFPQYVNKDTFKYMRDEWGINVVRLAMYSDPNAGYSLQQHKVVKAGVQYATELGMYVIIDWHILSDGNPNIYKTQAISFFTEMTNEYKNNDNVIYEICNEPNGDVQWSRDIKPYAEEVIAKIREIDSDAIIICGTPTWSQDVDIVANDPIKGYKNIMYTLHFYAGTHKEYLRNKVKVAIDAGLPLFVTEFGISDASGNGKLDEQEGNVWIDFLNKNNISWVCWNLSNKNESSSLISSSTNKITNWNDTELSDEGRWLINAIKRK